MMTRLLMTMVAIISTSSGVAADDLPRRDDYAYGFPIAVTEGGGVFQLELPLIVYQSVSDAELRDAGVFNGDGEPVPRIFRRDEDEIEKVESLHRLQMLPLYSKNQQPIDDIRMLVRRGDANAEVSFETSTAPLAGEKLSSYVVDTRPFEKPLTALEFEWTGAVRGFIGNVIVEGSNDLVKWSAAGSGALAELQEDEASVHQSRVELANHKYEYLRVRWTDMPEQWSLATVSGITTMETRTTNRRQLLLEAVATDDDGGRIFDTGGSVNVDRLRIVLPQRNSVVSGTIYYWSTQSNRWQYLAAASFDNLEQSADAGDATLSISSVRASRFKFVASKSGSTTDLQLEIGWRPDTLLFLASGKPPFLLATGNAADAHDRFPQQRLYEDRAITDIARRKGGVTTATLGERYPLGGDFRLTVREPVDWRSYSLWFALALGVALVGYMALRLIRDMKAGAT